MFTPPPQELSVLLFGLEGSNVAESIVDVQALQNVLCFAHEDAPLLYNRKEQNRLHERAKGKATSNERTKPACKMTARVQVAKQGAKSLFPEVPLTTRTRSMNGRNNKIPTGTKLPLDILFIVKSDVGK